MLENHGGSEKSQADVDVGRDSLHAYPLRVPTIKPGKCYIQEPPSREDEVIDRCKPSLSGNKLIEAAVVDPEVGVINVDHINEK